MKPSAKWVWCLGVPAAVVLSQLIARHEAGWVNIGLSGLLYDWLASLILGIACHRCPAARRPLRVLINVAIYDYPILWAFCLGTATTGSWIGGLPAAALCAVAVSQYRNAARKRRRRHSADDVVSA